MRNIETRLSKLPVVNMQRSKFDMPPFHHLTTMNAGKLVPIYLREVLPGSTESLNVRQLIRMSTPIHPTMDDAYIDTYFFFVPNRLTWENWEEFMGENKYGAWTKNQPTFTIPKIVFSEAAEKGSIADYFGIPTKVTGIKANALPFRAYALIWNDWFRDENVMDPIYINISANNSDYLPISNSYFFGADQGGALAPVSKFHDYFTSALPEPQRGEDVMLPLGDFAPVVTQELRGVTGSQAPLQFALASSGMSNINGSLGVSSGAAAVDASFTPAVTGLYPTNLFADLSEASSATINDLRMAIALQTFYERSARYGSRYVETLLGHFGVKSPDARLQIPEYLGGKRSKINVQQVLQTSSTDDVSPQGNTAGFSLTVDQDHAFTYSAVEHGYIIGLACIRTKQTYQYGLERHWSRNDMIDYYWPEFSAIGEQPILNKEIFAQGTDEDDEVFGYQEAWAEYRQMYSRLSGAFRSNYAQSLDSWHYAEKYESLPILSESFIVQSPDVIDRTLAVQSDVEDQFICDFYFAQTSVLPMPPYSIPGFSPHF